MISRRRFLQTGSLAAGVSVALPTLAHAAEGDKSLPPAIAALRTLRGEAKPITIEERAGRQENARRLMLTRENNLSAILLSGKAMARTGLRMMPTFPSPPLKFRTAGFPQYGFHARISDKALPRNPGLPSSFVPPAFAACSLAFVRDDPRVCTSRRAGPPALPPR